MIESRDETKVAKENFEALAIFGDFIKITIIHTGSLVLACSYTRFRNPSRETAERWRKSKLVQSEAGRCSSCLIVL